MLYLALSFDKSARSQPTISLSELQEEVSQLKAKVEFIFDRQESINSKLDLILRAFEKDHHLKKLVGNGDAIKDVRQDQETSLVITERLDQIERILTEAPEGNLSQLQLLL